MELKQIRAVPVADVNQEGVKGVKVQVLLGEQDRAPSHTMRLFFLEAGGHTPQHSHP